MKNPLFLKCALLALIGALLLIPLAMIEHTIDERTQHRAEAIRAIAASSAGEQSVSGPMLTIPVVEEYDDEQIEEINGETRKKTIRRKRTHTLTVLPRQLGRGVGEDFAMVAVDDHGDAVDLGIRQIDRTHHRGNTHGAGQNGYVGVAGALYRNQADQLADRHLAQALCRMSQRDCLAHEKFVVHRLSMAGSYWAGASPMGTIGL